MTLYNKHMKTFLIFFLLFGIIAISIVNVYAAADIEFPNPLVSNDITSLINTIATWLLGIGSTIAVVIVLWAAFLFMTSGGNKERVTLAKNTLWYAIIGITVLLLAKGVTLFIQNVLSG